MAETRVTGPALHGWSPRADGSGSGSDLEERPFHAVWVYDGVARHRSIVAAFLAAGFVAGSSALILATPEHTSEIMTGLRELSFSPDALRRSGRLTTRDASAVLEGIAVNGRPDPVRFTSFADGVLGSLAGSRGRVRIYSEIVDVVCERQSAASALALEALWDRYAATHAASVLCGHAAGSSTDHRGRQAICGHHSHVLAGDGLPHPAAR